MCGNKIEYGILHFLKKPDSVDKITDVNDGHLRCVYNFNFIGKLCHFVLLTLNIGTPLLLTIRLLKFEQVYFTTF